MGRAKHPPNCTYAIGLDIDTTVEATVVSVTSFDVPGKFTFLIYTTDIFLKCTCMYSVYYFQTAYYLYLSISDEDMQGTKIYVYGRYILKLCKIIIL